MAGRDPTALRSRALQLDTYDAPANFVAGNLYRALGRDTDAREAFGWSARAVAFRAASYIRLAEIAIGAGEWGEGKRYAERALDFDRNSVPAWQLLAAIGRLSLDEVAAERALAALLDIDPLHHFVLAERYLAEPTEESRAELLGGMTSEYPDQTLLELAVGYASRGLGDGCAVPTGGREWRTWRATRRTERAAGWKRRTATWPRRARPACLARVSGSGAFRTRPSGFAAR